MSIAGVSWRLRVLVAVVVAALAAAIAVAGAGDAVGAEFRTPNVGPSGTTAPVTSSSGAMRPYDPPGQRSGPSTYSIAGRLATKVGGGGGKKVVIGEDMQGRVIPEARRRGADYYDPPYLPPGQRMGHNRRWIDDRMDEGCTIFDCGAPGRTNFPNPTSRYYQMERDEIARRNYSRYVPPGGGAVSQMPIEIRRVGDLYEAKVTPPHGSGVWSTPEPMTVDDLDKKLFELGCHPTDIGDAFYEADPEWLERSKQ